MDAAPSDGPKHADTDSSNNSAPVLSRLAKLMGPPDPAFRSFVLATFVTSIGTGAYTTVAVVFFVRSLGLSAEFVGAGLTIAAALGLVASLPAGRLADRHSVKAVLVALCVCQAVLFALFTMVRGPAEFILIAVLVAMAASASYPVTQVLLADLAAGGSRVAAAAYNRSVLNVGMSLGALLAGWALAVGSRAAYDTVLIGNAASFVGAAALLGRIKVPSRRPPDPAIQRSGATRHPLRQPRLVAAAGVCGVLFLSASILDVGLPLQITQHTSAPRWTIAALLLLNTVLAVTLQVRASAGSESVVGAARANRLAGASLVGACILFSATADRAPAVAVPLLIGATVLLTGGELFSSAGAWGLSYGLAPHDEPGKYLASFGMLTQMVGVVGPALAADVVSSGATGWLCAGGVFLMAGIAAPFITRSGKRAERAPT